jgi:hypothetical protein
MLKPLLVALACLSCSADPWNVEAPQEPTSQPEQVPAPEPVPPAPPAPEPTPPLARACGCADLVQVVIPPGGCYGIANKYWATIEDDVACFDLTPGTIEEGGDGVCTRTCAGMLEIKNGTGADMLIATFDKLTGRTFPGGQPGLFLGDACDALEPGVRYAGGPTAETFPPPGASVCP